MFQLGIERLLCETSLQQRLKGKRLALLAHPASVTQSLSHTLDELKKLNSINVVAAFGPQHGMRGEKQDNMIESDDYVDPIHKIPVYSLYGKVRRPTKAMMKDWDVLLIDLQDVGCRIYTFLTTLFYMLDAVAETGQEIWVLDRPNPAGREVEGHTLDRHYASFVGAAPVPMRHGLTLGEAALWYREHRKLKVSLEVIKMTDYDPVKGPLFGWVPMCWVNPSPNMPRLSCARVYPGSVLIEGTNLSEGRGTTIPLEIFGAPNLHMSEILKHMKSMAPRWLEGCFLRPAFFEPTFHKFKGELVTALQVHTDVSSYEPRSFKPYRLITLFFKALHRVHPNFEIWRKPPYEYEEKLMPIDILSGHDQLRQWVAKDSALIAEWDASLGADELAWQSQRRDYLLYPS